MVYIYEVIFIMQIFIKMCPRWWMPHLNVFLSSFMTNTAHCLGFSNFAVYDNAAIYWKLSLWRWCFVVAFHEWQQWLTVSKMVCVTRGPGRVIPWSSVVIWSSIANNICIWKVGRYTLFWADLRSTFNTGLLYISIAPGQGSFLNQVNTSICVWSGCQYWKLLNEFVN